VGKAAGQNHRVGAGKIGVLVPDELGLLSEDVLGGIPRVAVGVGSGKNDYGTFHKSTTATLKVRRSAISERDAGKSGG
jgi:hypothetical protein